MGNISSCCFSGNKQEDERDETERLLDHAAGDGMVGHDHRNSINGDLNHTASVNGYGTVQDHGYGTRSESSAWNRTLNKMANSVIDVSSIEANSNGLEPSEYQDRQRLYLSKVINSRVPSILKNERLKTRSKQEVERKNLNNLLLEPISTDDLFLINEFMSQQQPQHKAFTGRVTKLLDNFGFVDDDVFFQLSVVRGGNVKVGDQVYVDCTYSEHLPFKWNAKCVQLLEQKQDMTPSPYMQHGMSGREPVDPRKGAGFYRDDSKTDAMYQQNRNPVFVSEYNQQPDVSKLAGSGMAQNVPVQQNYQQQMPQAVSTYGNIERDFKSAAFANNDQITYTSTPGSAFVTTQLQPQLVNVPPTAVGASRPANPNRSSRWGARDDNIRKVEDTVRSRPDRSENDSRPQREERRDQFGRDKFGRDRAPVERPHREPQRRERSPERASRVTESPASNAGTSTRSRYRPSDNILRYEVLKEEILTNDIKDRYGDKIRIPSDFEVLLVNKNFDLNIQTIPKPIKYKFKERSERSERKDRKSNDKVDESGQDKKEENGASMDMDESMEATDGNSQDVASTEKEEKPTPSEVDVKQDSGNGDDGGGESAFDTETSEPPSTVKKENSTPELKPTKIVPRVPKYGVKVVMLSLPSLTELYEEVCGYDFTKQVTRNHNTYFNRLVSFISFKNQNNGYSLVGGKFNLDLDGFLPGTERPNLIATAVRTVKEQTGVDLTPCTKWINVGTFVYNRNDTIGDDREYSVVFLPDVWSLLDKCDTLVKQEMNDDDDVTVKQNESMPTSDHDLVNSDSVLDQPDGADEVKKEPGDATGNATITTTNLPPSSNSDTSSSHTLSFPTICVPSSSDVSDVPPAPAAGQQSSAADVSEKQQFLDRINELKVTELKAHLDERDLKYNRSAKKAELVSILTDAIKAEIGSLQHDDNQQQTMDTTNGSSATATPVENVDDPKPDTVKVEPISTDSTAATEATESGDGKAPKRRHESEDGDSGRKSLRTSPPAVVKPVADSMINVTGDLHLMTLSLYQALNHHKNDHFELGLTAELLREAIVKHFTEYCLSCLVANHKSGKVAEPDDRRKVQSRPPTFVNLAFAYFDDNVRGHLNSDDLLHNVQNCGYKLSKRSWNALTSSNDRISYRNFDVPSCQTVLPSKSIKNPLEADIGEVGSGGGGDNLRPIFSLNGIIYDGANLVSQSEKYTKSLAELKEMSDQLETQTKSLKEFELKQKKMTSAIEKQNDEMCGLKRERESLKSKNDELKKAIESTVTTFSDLLKKNSKDD